MSDLTGPGIELRTSRADSDVFNNFAQYLGFGELQCFFIYLPCEVCYLPTMLVKNILILQTLHGLSCKIIAATHQHHVHHMIGVL